MERMGHVNRPQAHCFNTSYYLAQGVVTTGSPFTRLVKVTLYAPVFQAKFNNGV